METGKEENNEIKRERIRVKKRIKIKKKSDPKSKFKKGLVPVVWVIIILLFIYMLVVMVKEADIKDDEKSYSKPAGKNYLTTSFAYRENNIRILSVKHFDNIS